MTKRHEISRVVAVSLLCLATIVPKARAIGPTFLPTSFEELVHDSTHIVVVKVESTSKQPEADFKFKRKAVVEVERALKGNISSKTILIDYEVTYPTVDVTVAEGHTYLLFLYREKEVGVFTYTRPDWTCWEVDGDQLVNNWAAIQQVTKIQMAGFLRAIASERHRTAKPLARSFAGIRPGDSLEQASRSSGLTFSKYTQRGDDANWERYYVLLPRDRLEHLVTLSLYEGKIVYLEIYVLQDSDGWAQLIRRMELMSGGTPLGQFDDLSFAMGRMWSDRNILLRLGKLSFIKANGYPWGEFDAYHIWVTDQHVLHEYLKESQTSAAGHLMVH
jgi:hypothetical protein